MLKRQRVLWIFIAVMVLVDLLGFVVLRDAWQSRQNELMQKREFPESAPTPRSAAPVDRKPQRPAT